jgi:hypothetical protein
VRSMDGHQGFIGWALAGVSTIIAFLAGVVTDFYRRENKRRDQRETSLLSDLEHVRDRLDDCERDRAEIKSKYAVLEERIKWVEDRVRRHDP